MDQIRVIWIKLHKFNLYGLAQHDIEVCKALKKEKHTSIKWSSFVAFQIQPLLHFEMAHNEVVEVVVVVLL